MNYLQSKLLSGMVPVIVYRLYSDKSINGANYYRAVFVNIFGMKGLAKK
jgi:hypothetical protein